MDKSALFLIVLMNLNISLLSGAYEVGDSISIADQQVPHDICYGEYENDVYMISDANYLLNGGTRKITIMKLSAAW